MKYLAALLASLTLVTAVQAQGTTAPTALVTWVAPTTNTDGSTITGAISYNLYQGTSCSTLTRTSTSSALSTTSTTVTGLTPGTTYCFAVTAVVGGSESAKSATAQLAVPTPTPGAPSQITVVLH